MIDDDGKTYYGLYSSKKFGMGPQSIGATHRGQKNSLTQPWKLAKPSYAAILSSDKHERRPKKTDVHVDNSICRPRFAPIDPIGLPQQTRQEPGISEDGNREQLLNLDNKELRGQRDALVLDGPCLRAPPLRLLKAPLTLQVPRAIKGRPSGAQGGQVAQTPTRRNREADREIRTEARGDQNTKKLPGSGWSDIERSRILERCGAELR